MKLVKDIIGQKKKNEVASQRPRSPNLKQPTKEIDNL